MLDGDADATRLLPFDFGFDRLRTDTRAIEGLPVRLVVALVVGVASLSVMMNMIRAKSSMKPL